MNVNPKKNISLRNRTFYFSPDKDKVKVSFASPCSYRFRQSKIEGYESRLYWQFKYCQDFNGQVFYYTLTYNNRSIPHYYGAYCFDYEHLRDLLTGGFRKILLRKYGTSFKYFIGAELGDGKGKRGLHNNPHYHVLFFLESANNCKFPYHKISPEEFRHYVRLYWQGFDESVTGFRSYKTAKYGSVKEGENLGLVTDFRACMYCAKYVCKDAGLKMHEEKVEKFLRFKHRSEMIHEHDVWCDFFHQVVYDKFNVPLNASKTSWQFTDEELLLRLMPDEASRVVDVFGEIPLSDLVIRSYTNWICSKYRLWNEFNQFVSERVQVKVDEGLTEWRNRFCNKCRISHGVGDYALKFMDKLNPCVSVPSKHGFKNRSVGLYYYRKLYYDVVRPIKKSKVHEKPSSYSPVRVLNQDGLDYKVHQLKASVDKLAAQASSQFNLLLGNRELFDMMKASDVNTEVTCSFDKIIEYGNSITQSIFYRYAYYKLVYENRFFKISDSRGVCVCEFPDVSPFDDYRKFLVSSFHYVDRNGLLLDTFVEGGCSGYFPYISHPYFLRYSSLFSVLDLCADYFFVQNDNEAQRKAVEIAETKRYHNQRKLKQYYYGTTVF